MLVVPSLNTTMIDPAVLSTASGGKITMADDFYGTAHQFAD